MYLIDNAIIRLVGFNPTENLGPLLENLIFIELKRRNKDIFYHANGSECDFIVRTGTRITQCIQVTVSIADENTRKREVTGLTSAIKTYNTTDNTIITLADERISMENNGIRVVPAWRWLLE